MPQHRERVLIVSIRKDIDNGIFEFPAPVELTKCMNDYLEEVVDEKYFVDTEKAKALIPKLRQKLISNAIRGGGRGTIDLRHQWDLVVVSDRGSSSANKEQKLKN